jgi:hypothetical protein
MYKVHKCHVIYFLLLKVARLSSYRTIRGDVLGSVNATSLRSQNQLTTREPASRAKSPATLEILTASLFSEKFGILPLSEVGFATLGSFQRLHLNAIIKQGVHAIMPFYYLIK